MESITVPDKKRTHLLKHNLYVCGKTRSSEYNTFSVAVANPTLSIGAGIVHHSVTAHATVTFMLCFIILLLFVILSNTYTKNTSSWQKDITSPVAMALR